MAVGEYPDRSWKPEDSEAERPLVEQSAMSAGVDFSTSYAPRERKGTSPAAYALAISFLVVAGIGACTVMKPRRPAPSPEHLRQEKANAAAIAAEDAAFSGYDSSESVTKCDLMMRSQADLPRSYKSDWTWQEKRDQPSGAVGIHRGFHVTNAFNAEIEGSYTCVVDAATNAVVGLQYQIGGETVVAFPRP